MAGWQVGIDIGGTFTDVVAFNVNTHEVLSAKVKSVPGDPIQGLLNGLEGVGLAWSDVDELIHGTTIATNAIVERHLARTALVTTEGFGDVLAIGRQNRRHLYRLDLPPKLPPLVPAELSFEIEERMNFSGEIVRPIEPSSVDALLRQLVEHKVEAAAVSLLHSYANPVHELELLGAIRSVVPHVALSHRVNPESREFERANTTALSAGIMPLVANYVDMLEAKRPETSRLHFFHSASGLCSPAVAREQPLSLALSGPAAGVAAASRIAQSLDLKRALTFDMGGTTTDVCLISGGVAEVTSDRTLADQPLRMPTVAVEAIGAGGGSLVHLNGGVLRVGPDSAGANPGPACYGLGGTVPTVADACIILGYLEDGATFGGSIRLSRAKAAEALAPIAAKLGLDIISTARGVLKIANNLMANALRRVSVERGIDARSCTLIAYGGAGPMHAIDVARLVGIMRIVVPEYSSAFSALGCLSADTSYAQHQTIRVERDRWDSERLANVRASMLESARNGIGQTDMQPEFGWVASVRYIGQSYSVEIPDPELDNPDDLEHKFYARHEELYGFASSEPWEITALRLTARVKRNLAAKVPARLQQAATAETFRGCYFHDTTPVRVPDHKRGTLAPDQILQGPAIISDQMSTLVLPPGAIATVTAAGHLDIRLETTP